MKKGYLTIPTYLEHLGYTDAKPITYLYLGYTWNAIEQIKMDKYILIWVILSFHKHKNKQIKEKNPSITLREAKELYI